jgi:hypothetical protein
MMIVRDMLIPIAYSELVSKEMRIKLVSFSEIQVTILGFFTYFTAISFLTMYYYFSNRQNNEEKNTESDKKNIKNYEAAM